MSSEFDSEILIVLRPPPLNINVCNVVYMYTAAKTVFIFFITTSMHPFEKPRFNLSF